MLFRFKLINDDRERTYGVAFRFLGIDISLIGIGWLNEWSLIDLRIPCNYGIYLQMGFLIFSMGRLPSDEIYNP